MTDFITLNEGTLTIGGFSITFTWSGALEIILFAIISYYVILWIKRSKAWTLLKGGAVVLVVYLLSRVLRLENILYLYEKLFSSLLIALIVIFQPEIRRALEQLGRKKFFYKFLPTSESATYSRLNLNSINSIVDAMTILGRNKVGALIILERDITLSEYVETGISLDANINAALLEQIFEHNTPLHDGAVIIRDNRIVAATCYLPLSENMSISKDLGTRHRAGLGVSEGSDCITLIASEETGAISVAVGGQLVRNVTGDELRDILIQNGADNAHKEGIFKNDKVLKDPEDDYESMLFSRFKKKSEEKSETIEESTEEAGNYTENSEEDTETIETPGDTRENTPEGGIEQ